MSSAVEATRNPLTSRPLTVSEILLSAALFTALGLAIYLPHILNGGWYVDDWILIARMHESSGLLGAFEAMQQESFRPGLALALSLFYEIGGTGHAGYLTIGALLAAIQGWLFYLVLRILRLRIAVAAIVAAIFVVLPVIDATRLWISAFPTQVAGILYLLGVLIAMYGATHANGRRALVWHAGAAAFYFGAILTYELISGLVAVAVLLYIVRSGWRPALRRWPADLASIALALAILIPRGAADREAHTSLSFIWERASGTLTQAEVVFRWLLPVHGVLGGPVGVVLLVVGMLGAGIAIGRGDETGGGLASWAKIAGLSTVFSLAGLAMLLPADPYFVPRISGMGDRTGAFAAFGAVSLLVALIVLTLGGLGTLLRRPRIGFALAATLVLLTGLNLAGRELRQQDPWADSWREQNEVLAGIDSAMGGEIPANAALVSFGHTTFIEPADVSVFAYNWDLKGALWEIYKRPEVEAHPWAVEARCESAGVVFPEEEVAPGAAYPFGYRKLFFVDAATRTAKRIRDQAECETTAAVMTGQPTA
jgi:hypothetical protein